MVPCILQVRIVLRISHKTVTCTRRSRSAAKVSSSYTVVYGALHVALPVLDDRIDHFGELVKDYYNVEELGDPSAVTEVCGTSSSRSRS